MRAMTKRTFAAGREVRAQTPIGVARAAPPPRIATDRRSHSCQADRSPLRLTNSWSSTTIGTARAGDMMRLSSGTAITLNPNPAKPRINPAAKTIIRPMIARGTGSIMCGDQRRSCNAASPASVLFGFWWCGAGSSPPTQGIRRHSYFIVGMTKSAPVRMPVGQRVVIVFRRV